MTLLDPVTDLQTALNGQTLASTLLSSSKNLFAGDVWPANLPVQEAVVLQRGGSRAVEPYLGGDASVIRESVQTSVYGVPGAAGHVFAESLSRAVAGYLHLLSVAGYVSVVLESTPSFQGEDSEGRAQFSFQVEVTYTA